MLKSQYVTVFLVLLVVAPVSALHADLPAQWEIQCCGGAFVKPNPEEETLMANELPFLMCKILKHCNPAGFPIFVLNSEINSK